MIKKRDVQIILAIFLILVIGAAAAYAQSNRIYLPLVVKPEEAAPTPFPTVIVPTLTPNPTNTPLPADTPIPTNTPLPSDTPIPTDTPKPKPKGVHILPNYTDFTSSIDTFHVVGEVQNDTGDSIRFVKISANFYDAQNNLIDTDFSFGRIDILPPGDKTCFNLFLDDVPVGLDHYEFEAPTYSTSPDQLPALTVLSHSGSVTDIFDWYEIIGEVRNDHGSRVDFVSPIGTLYNASGDVLDCDFTFVNSTHLDPGQKSSFKMTFVLRGEYDSVASYRLQVDGNP